MKTKTVKLNWQQGDLIGRKLKAMPDGEQKTISLKRCVLAHGESGHTHILEDDDAELIQIGERILLKLTKTATVTHEEHGAITLDKGIWEIGRVQEYDYFSKMTRAVQD